jgi:hypothetical protein
LKSQTYDISVRDLQKPFREFKNRNSFSLTNTGVTNMLTAKLGQKKKKNGKSAKGKYAVQETKKLTYEQTDSQDLQMPGHSINYDD